MKINSCNKLFTSLFLGLFIATGALFGGDIIGTVRDANSGSILSGAQITLGETGRSAVSDNQGNFRFRNVPGGNQRLIVSYLGFDNVIETVQVPETGNVTSTIQMGGEITELEAFEVQGFTEARIRALQQKKTATTTMDIISSDSIGTLPDRNVADALSRLPGVNTTLDNGESRFVVIRGIDPNLNNVTLNGATMAAPGVNGRSGRSMPLDVIGSSQISQLEVLKTVTPDLDGNSIGGTINIVTASAWDRKDNFTSITAEVGQVDRADRETYGLEASWSNVLNAERTLGLSLSASYNNRPLQVDELESRWFEINGIFLPVVAQFVPIEGDRERIGLTANLEYRPDPDTEFYIRAIANRFDEFESLEEHIFEVRNASALTPTSGAADRVRVERREKQEITEQELMNISVGGSWKQGNWTFSPEVTYSYAEEFNPLLNWAQWRGEYRDQADNPAEGITDIVSWDTTNYLYDFNINPVTHTDLSVMELRRFRVEDSTVEETTWSPKIDIQYDFPDWGQGFGFVKFGAKYTTRERFVNDNSNRFVNAGRDTLMSDYGPHDPNYSLLDQYNTGLSVNWDNTFAAYDQFLASGDIAFDAPSSSANSVEDDYDYEEDILAFYAYLDYTVQDFNILAGFRYEKTDASVGANEFREDERDGTDFVIEPIGPIDIDYENWFPNVQFRYQASDFLVFRGAITYTVGRPAYEDAAPITSRELEILAAPLDPAFPFVGEVEIGRPDLEPYESWNLDAGIEYYLPEGAGVFSAAVFAKEIDNPIFSFEGEGKNVVWDGDAFEELEFEGIDNAESGEIRGLEVAMQLPFRFLQAPFDGFGFDVNATFIDSEAVIEDVNVYLLEGAVEINRTGDPFPFFRQPDLIYNVALYYEKFGFNAKLAYQYQDEQIVAIGGSSATDIWRDEVSKLDFQTSYWINDNWKVFGNISNITDEEQKVYLGSPDRSFLYQSFGRTFRVGATFTN